MQAVTAALLRDVGLLQVRELFRVEHHVSKVVPARAIWARNEVQAVLLLVRSWEPTECIEKHRFNANDWVVYQKDAVHPTFGELHNEGVVQESQRLSGNI